MVRTKQLLLCLQVDQIYTQKMTLNYIYWQVLSESIDMIGHDRKDRTVGGAETTKQMATGMAGANKHSTGLR